MKVLITGAGGLLGQAAQTHFGNSCELLALDHHQLDITDREAALSTIETFAPDLLLNCAAMARVDACETDRELAWSVNLQGPSVLASAALQFGAAIMHISTDYVFDGEKRTPYTIEDIERPLSAYGLSKLEGERAVVAANARHFIVRVARLFGIGGSNFGSRIFHNLKQASDNNEKIRVFRYPLSQATYLPDLAGRLLEIAERGEYGVYHVTSSGPVVSWREFVEEAVGIMGLDRSIMERIEQVEYEASGLAARRPYYSALRCLLSERLGLAPLRDWREGLVEMYEKLIF
jgi:dTDP-4-dehydrorhamnose reductase